ncbi:MAG: class I SAM-dependent methyltransferase [Acidobacteria bacterium]|nr:class I SAM-dependent methyltransferase [Acidobacteriota bacterium]
MRRPRNGIFDRLAPIYDLFARGYGLSRAVAALEPLDGGALLDLGGGTGRLASQAVERGARAAVADASGAMLARARRKGLPTLRARAERLPLADASLDRVAVVDAFHHMEDLAVVAREIARVLRPGGRAVLFEPDPERFAGRWVARFEHWSGMGSLILPGRELADLFSGAGLATRVERAPFHLLVVAIRPPAGTLFGRPGATPADPG